MQVVPLSEPIGADVLDVDIRRLSEDDFRYIYQAWLNHSVLRFRGQRLTEDDLQHFSQRFGPLEQIPHFDRIPEEIRTKIKNRFVTVISNITIEGRPIGALGSAEAAWHSDMSYMPDLPTASVLFSVEIPPEGGDTSFACQYAAYDALPQGLKDRIAGLTLKHNAAHTSIGELRLGFEAPTSPAEAPGAIHPIVRVHPETGRKALFVGRREWGYVMGLSPEESERLLDELWAHAARAEFVWRQVWRRGDLIVWDNRCCLHRRDAFDPRLRRLMLRCQVLANDDT